MTFPKVLKAIKQNKTFLISTHVNPDIDGLASELAVALFLRALKKDVHVVNTGKILPMYSFLPKIGLIKEFDGRPLRYDAAIIVDCGDLDRIDRVKKILLKGKPVINIDHHITNARFGTINLVHPKASSTAEVIFDLLKSSRQKLTKDMAVLLYLGILTDTGSFRYDNTSAHTHAVVSELMQFNFSVNKFYKKIYETVPLKELKLFTRLISSFQMNYGGKVASMTLTKSVLKTFSGSFDLRDRIFNFLRSIKGVEVIVILSEGEKGATRVNFRSQGKVDVSRIASLFGGGGHKKASGCRVDGNIKEAKRKIFRELKPLLKEV